MGDFRVDAVKQAVNSLGWSCESYDESQSQLIVNANGTWYISFADKKEIKVNVPVMEIPAKILFSGMIPTLLQLTNEKCSYVKFDQMSEYIIACSAISSSIFLRTDNETELKEDLMAMHNEMVAGTRALESFISRLLD